MLYGLFLCYCAGFLHVSATCLRSIVWRCTAWLLFVLCVLVGVISVFCMCSCVLFPMHCARLYGLLACAGSVYACVLFYMRLRVLFVICCVMLYGVLVSCVGIVCACVKAVCVLCVLIVVCCVALHGPLFVMCFCLCVFACSVLNVLGCGLCVIV